MRDIFHNFFQPIFTKSAKTLGADYIAHPVFFFFILLFFLCPMDGLHQMSRWFIVITAVADVLQSRKASRLMSTVIKVLVRKASAT